MAGKQLVQSCYAVVWAGFEPTTFELQGITLSNEPRHPVRVCGMGDIFKTNLRCLLCLFLCFCIIQKFSWAGQNNFFIGATVDSLSFGASE